MSTLSTIYLICRSRDYQTSYSGRDLLVRVVIEGSLLDIPGYPDWNVQATSDLDHAQEKICLNQVVYYRRWQRLHYLDTKAHFSYIGKAYFR